MSERDTDGNDVVLGDQDVAEILERAVKLDGARAGKVTVAQLREAALEVGVSRAAFDAALDEYAREEVVRPASTVAVAPIEARPRFFAQIRTSVTVAAGAVVGSVSGMFFGASGGTGEEYIVVGALVMVGAALRLVLSHRRDRKLLPFVIDTIWLWSSFLVGTSIFSGFITEEPIIGTVVMIVMTAIVGGIFVKQGESDAGGEPKQLPR